jgi:hypothetical protein
MHDVRGLRVDSYPQPMEKNSMTDQAGYYVIITDTWPVCPGTIKLGPYRSREIAEDRAQREMDQAAKALKNAMTNLSYTITEEMDQ